MRKLASWAGLTPTVRGSDRTIRHGHISKQGSAWLRWALAEAAQNAKRSPQFAGGLPRCMRQNRTICAWPPVELTHRRTARNRRSGCAIRSVANVIAKLRCA